MSGIVSTGLTERRQRLGDLVADTIVIESRSMNQMSLSDMPGVAPE